MSLEGNISRPYLQSKYHRSMMIRDDRIYYGAISKSVRQRKITKDFAKVFSENSIILILNGYVLFVTRRG